MSNEYAIIWSRKKDNNFNKIIYIRKGEKKMEDFVSVMLIVGIILHIIAGAFMCDAAQKKGHSWGIFWVCLFLGLAGWLYVCALPDLKQQQNQERIIALLEAGGTDPGGANKSSNVKLDDDLPPL